MPTPPNKIYDWATDANFDTAVGPPSSPWHGEPTKVEPVSQDIAQGFVPSQLVSGQHINYILNSHGEWIDFLSGAVEPLYSGPTPVTSTYSAHVFTGDSSGQTSIYRQFRTASEWAGFDLTKAFPSGSVIERIDIIVDPGTAIANSVDRMLAVVTRVDFDFATPQVINASTTTITADATSLQQVITITGPWTVGEMQSTYTQQHFVRVRASISASVSLDELRAMQIRWIRPPFANGL
jgi:hypothetical protein